MGTVGMTNRLYVHDQEKWEKLYAKSYLLSTEPAQASVYHDAVILPARRFLIDADHRDGMYEGGVCTADFQFLAGHTRKPGKESNLDCCRAYAVEIEQVERRDERVVFGGILIPHFGHMLIDDCTHLWYLTQTDEYEKVVFIRYSDYHPIQCDPLMLVYAMGVPKEKVEVIQHPTQFREVVVPEESFASLAGYRREFMDVYHAITARIPRGIYQKIYLSRSRFEEHDMINEHIFERFYERRGFRIVYPETLSFAQQISLVSGADEIVTTSGTLAE